VQVAVLGPVRLVRETRDVELGTPKQRGLLAALALRAGRPVPPDTLVEVLWGESAPAAVTASLQAYVAGLRRALEPDRPARAPATVLVTSAAGYTLNLPAGDLDAARFAETVQRVRRRLLLTPGDLPVPPTDVPPPELDRLERDLREVLGLWVGLPYADLRDADDVVAERSRLAELRLIAQEDLALVRLARGEHAAVAAELQGLSREHPLREPIWALQALALAGAGRQGDALATLRQARSVLADELGVDPGAALQALETAVLQQDPRLQRTVPVPAGLVPAPRPAPAPSPPAPAAPAPDRPRLVGRTAELAVLDDVLASAARGTPASALLVGEPGIGKSRLLEEVGARARASGFAVLTGRCSRDEGAPPMWPWTGVLRDLAAAVPLDALDVDLGEVKRLVDGGDADDRAERDAASADASRFRTGEAVVSTLSAAATQRPLLVVLDDLHWSDASSLRLLGQVLEDLPAPTRVAVVASRRSAPAPSGALAALGEVLVRRGTRRLDLRGLSPAEVAELVELTASSFPASSFPAASAVQQLHDRTEGNALFVVELVRLGSPPGSVPAGVSDVVAARLAQLPGSTSTVLQSAAVLGRRFDLDLLTAVSGLDEDAVLDALDPATAAGLVVEEGVGAFRFSHALVADAVREHLPATRRARRHAAAAAGLEAGRGLAGTERLAETARHWLAAGPSQAHRAWRAAAAAAEQAHRLYAHEEAAALLAAALDALDQDANAGVADRYTLLMRRAEACRRAADLVGHDVAQHEAVLAARALGDLDRLVAAAANGVTGVLWTARAYGTVDSVVVDALEEALDRLPAADSPLRCRALVALAGERYYAPGVEQREALAEEGVAMAERIGDPELLRWACGAAAQALWRPERLGRRVELAREALALSVDATDVAAEAFARGALAIALQEAGRIAEMEEHLQVASVLADRARLPYVQVVLGWLQVPWLALRGRIPEAHELFLRTVGLAERTSMPNREEGAAGAVFTLMLAAGQAAEAVAVLEALTAASPMPVRNSLLSVLVRAGRLDDARAQYEAGGLSLGNDDWLSVLALSQAAEVALRLGLPDEGARVYAALAPCAGRLTCAGSGVQLGPVDLFLACAAAAVGEASLATAHADAARGLCEQWDVPVAAGWLRDLRAEHGF
jgi:DNA-binding SARP family transcriptional activator